MNKSKTTKWTAAGILTTRKPWTSHDYSATSTHWGSANTLSLKRASRG